MIMRHQLKKIFLHAIKNQHSINDFIIVLAFTFVCKKNEGKENNTKVFFRKI